MKNILKMVGLCFITAFLILAADPNGKWEASMPGRNGETMKMTFNLKADGDKLTGSVAGMRGETQISDGKVEGDSVSFSVVREFNGNQMKQNYKGSVEGDTIHFSVVREGGNGPGGERKFDAKKQ